MEEKAIKVSKVKVIMLTNVNHGLKDGKKIEIEEGTIVTCSPEVAEEFKFSGAAKDYVQPKRKEIEI